MSNTPSKWVDYSTGLCIALFVVTQSVLAIAPLSGGTNWAHLVGAWSVPIALPVLFAIAGMHSRCCHMLRHCDVLERLIIEAKFLLSIKF